MTVDDRASDRDPAVQALLDKQEIREALMRYCRGVDRWDEALIRSAFHPDAHDDHGPFQGAASDFPEWALGVLRNNSVTTHFVGNQLIEVEGDVAYSEAYLVALHRFERDGEQYDWVMGGRYVDRFERRGGEWKIADRVTVHDWTRVDPVVETFAFADRFVQGVRSPDDAAYRRLASSTGGAT